MDVQKIIDLWLESERRRCGEDSQLPEEWSSADIEKAALAWWAER